MSKIVNSRILIINFLFIIDVLKDFCAGGALAVKDGDAVVAPINKMITWAAANDAEIVVIREWHPPNSKHFKDFGGVWPIHGVENTRGAELHDDLAVKETNATHFYKGTSIEEHGYSGWEGKNTEGWPLEKFVRQIIRMMMEKYANKFDTVLVNIYHCGLATDFCDKATSLGSVKFINQWIAENPKHRNARCYLVQDAVRAVNLKEGDGDRAIKEMQNAGVIVTNSEEVCCDN